ncbi:ESX secretion-associated protein EspG [Amycolatopsis taiwanensis]|uniref:ESX secretion-associated protein EspG n=1 Tax=Amycolatopsis taiwanensis TaxID=342230 RepID=A0A9W6R0P2_9PSEU|nr:ESX secretion-associated protein EspG [Amycolatopsis taiwanensis]GLY66466.1 ESX secretion-associated protein EspG [Amycolatopsis taiwanensis]
MARRMTTVDGVVLSHQEYDLLWADLQAGPQPYPLEVRSHGYTMAERDELGGHVFETLAQGGFVDEHDEVDPRLDELLMLLAGPAFSVDALVLAEVPLRVLAAAGTRDGVLAVLDERELALRPCRPHELVDLVAGVIGDRPPGPGQSVRLPREVFSAAMNAFAGNGFLGFERTLADAGVAGRETRALATIVESPRAASGQAAANRAGRRSPVVTWYDTEAGRYAAIVEEVAGTRWVTVTPADGRWLAGRIGELLDRLAPG